MTRPQCARLALEFKGFGAGGAGPVTSAGIDRPRILLLCTANRCRSPMAEGLLRAMLAEQGIVADVSSAGLYEGGYPATADAVDVLGARGVDIAGHRSRNLDDVEVGLADADLVLTMERRHLQEAILRSDGLRSRAFTLVDFVRRAEAAESRRPGQDLRAYAAALAAGRRTAELIGLGDDDVADPIGRGRADYEATASLLHDLLRRAVARAFPVEEARSA